MDKKKKQASLNSILKKVEKMHSDMLSTSFNVDAIRDQMERPGYRRMRWKISAEKVYLFVISVCVVAWTINDIFFKH